MSEDRNMNEPWNNRFRYFLRRFGIRPPRGEGPVSEDGSLRESTGQQASRRRTNRLRNFFARNESQQLRSEERNVTRNVDFTSNGATRSEPEVIDLTVDRMSDEMPEFLSQMNNLYDSDDIFLTHENIVLDSFNPSLYIHRGDNGVSLIETEIHVHHLDPLSSGNERTAGRSPRGRFRRIRLQTDESDSTFPDSEPGAVFNIDFLQELLSIFGVTLNLDTPESFEREINLFLNSTVHVVRGYPRLRPRGVPKDVLKSLNTFKYNRGKFGSKNEPTPSNCCICLDKYKTGSLLIELFPCEHIFHKKCVTSWLKNNDTCPFCRSSIKSPENNEIL